MPQGNGYGKMYGTREKKRTDKSYRQNGTQNQTYYTTQESRKNGQYLPTKGTSNGQDGNGGDKDRNDKRKFRNSKYDFENKKDEESDTEDSCELEITPKQLSQVVPGGGVLKINQSKKKPIKITAEAPDGEPGPAQTKVKTVHDPMNRGDGQSISRLKPCVVVGVGQSVEGKIPLGGIRQPVLRMSREKRPNIPPGRMGRPNGDDNGTSDRNGYSHDHGNGPNENGRPGGNGDPPDRRGGRPPRGNGNPDGGDRVLTLMTMGMEMILHPQQILILPGEGAIENPNMFMYCKGLQGHQARKGNLDKQEEMAEMDKHCH